jgi:hypothetical protein
MVVVPWLFTLFAEADYILSTINPVFVTYATTSEIFILKCVVFMQIFSKAL